MYRIIKQEHGSRKRGTRRRRGDVAADGFLQMLPATQMLLLMNVQNVQLDQRDPGKDVHLARVSHTRDG